MTRRFPSRVTTLAIALVLATGCALTNINVVNDHRLTFLSPPSRAHLHLPVALRWSIRDFTPMAPGVSPPSNHSGYFAVFVDRSPIAPGESIRSVARNDTSCRRTPGCPDAHYLSDRQIYLTEQPGISLGRVDNLAGSREHEQLHEVTVILLDTTGHRIGESAWYRDFWLPEAGLT